MTNNKFNSTNRFSPNFGSKQFSGTNVACT